MLRKLATYIFIITTLSTWVSKADAAVQIGSIDIGTAINKMIVDPNRPFIYAINRENNSLLFIDISGTPDENSQGEISIGSLPADLDIDSSGDTLFVANSGGTEIAVVDLNSQTKTDSIFVDFSPLSLDAGKQGRLYYATSENPPNVRIVDTENKEDIGVVIGAADGGGFIVTSDGNGAYMQGGGSTRLYDISTDAPSELDSAQFTSQETFLLNSDETKLFHGKLAFNALDLTQVLGSFNETIYAITSQANLAFGRNNIHNAQTFTVIEPMPVHSTVLAISNDGTKLYVFDPDDNKIKIFSLLPSLTLSVGANNPSDTYELNDASDVAMLQINLAATILDTSVANGINISSITFTATGTGDELNDISAVNLVEDVNGNGSYDDGTDILLGTQTFDADDGNVTFDVDEVISRDSPVDWLVTYNFTGTADDLDTFSLAISANTDITASQSVPASGVLARRVTAISSLSPEGVTVTGAPVNGPTKTIKSVGSLSVTVGANNPSDTNERSDAANVVMQQLTLSASSVADVTINSISFSASGTGDDSTDISLIKLYKDEDGNGILDSETDTLIASSNSAYDVDDGEVTFDGLSEMVNAGENVDWLVVYDFAGTADDFETFAISVNDGAVSATEASYGQEITSAGSADGATKTIRSLGSLSVSTGANNPLNGNARSDATDVVMEQLTLSASSAADVTVNSITFSASGTGDSIADISSVNLYNDVNDNGILDNGIDILLGSGTFGVGTSELHSHKAVSKPFEWREKEQGSGGVWEQRSGVSLAPLLPRSSASLTPTVTFDGLAETISAGSSVNWLVTYSFSGNADDFTTFSIRIMEGAVTCTESSFGETISSVGSARGATKTIISLGSLVVSNGIANPNDGNVSKGANGLPVMQVNLAASESEDITVEEITLAISGAVNGQNAISAVNLYKDVNSNGVVDPRHDVLLATINNVGGTLTFSNLSEIIPAGKYVNWLVTCDISSAAVEGVDFTLEALESAVLGTGDISGESVVSSGTASGAKIVIVSFDVTKAFVKRSPSKSNPSSQVDSNAKITGIMPTINLVGPTTVSVGSFSQTISLIGLPKHRGHFPEANPQKLVFRSPRRSKGIQQMKIDLRKGRFAIKLARANILDWGQVLPASQVQKTDNITVAVEIRNGSNVLVEEIALRRHGKVLKFKKQ